jgi:hypothetical protein
MASAAADAFNGDGIATLTDKLKGVNKHLLFLRI